MSILIILMISKKSFSQKAISIEGSGWCWLVFNETYHKIEIVTTPNQDSPWTLTKNTSFRNWTCGSMHTILITKTNDLIMLNPGGM